MLNNKKCHINLIVNTNFESQRRELANGGRGEDIYKSEGNKKREPPVRSFMHVARVRIEESLE